MKSRASLASARKRRDDRMGYGILALAALVTLVIGLGAWKFSPVKRDANGCPTDRRGPPPAEIVILVDQTDRLPPRELDFVRQLVLNEYHWLPTDGVLSIRGIQDDEAEARAPITVCRMSDGSDSLGVLSTPAAQKREFDEKVGVRLQQFLDGMDKREPSRWSPIMEAVGGVFADPRFGPDVKQRRLVIVSDMAQNSTLYSQYGRSARARFVLPSKAGDELAADMSGVAVRIQYVKRPSIGFQGARHQAFWAEYFRKMGASDVQVGHALGLGEPVDRPIYRLPDR